MCVYSIVLWNINYSNLIYLIIYYGKVHNARHWKCTLIQVFSFVLRLRIWRWRTLNWRRNWRSWRISWRTLAVCRCVEYEMGVMGMFELVLALLWKSVDLCRVSNSFTLFRERPSCRGVLMMSLHCPALRSLLSLWHLSVHLIPANQQACSLLLLLLNPPTHSPAPASSCRDLA